MADTRKIHSVHSNILLDSSCSSFAHSDLWRDSATAVAVHRVTSGATYLAASPFEVLDDGGAAVAALDPPQPPLRARDLLHHLVPVGTPPGGLPQFLQPFQLGFGQRLLFCRRRSDTG